MLYVSGKKLCVAERKVSEGYVLPMVVLKGVGV